MLGLIATDWVKLSAICWLTCSLICSLVCWSTVSPTTLAISITLFFCSSVISSADLPVIKVISSSLILSCGAIKPTFSSSVRVSSKSNSP